MNLDRMLVYSHFSSKSYLRFKYYGDFEAMKWIVLDCSEDLAYIGNSSIDAAPVFLYTFEDIDISLLRNFQELNAHLRKLRIRNITKKDLTKKEKSLLTFFSFFMINNEKHLIVGVRDSEIKEFNKPEEQDYDD